MTARGQDAAGVDALKLMGIEDVAKILGTHRDNVRRWIDTGALPALFVGDTLEPKVSRLMLAEWQAKTIAEGAPVRAVRKRRAA